MLSAEVLAAQPGGEIMFPSFAREARKLRADVAKESCRDLVAGRYAGGAGSKQLPPLVAGHLI
jgi:hypothetical protein